MLFNHRWFHNRLRTTNDYHVCRKRKTLFDMLNVFWLSRKFENRMILSYSSKYTKSTEIANEKKNTYRIAIWIFEQRVWQKRQRR